MEYDGYDEIVRAWIQGVYDSRGNDAKRTLKLCYDIEPVSYTHLDVYKRQRYHFTTCARICVKW